MYFSWSVICFCSQFSFALFAVINVWITSCVWRETCSIFHCQEYSIFHSYRFNECSLFLLLRLVFIFRLDLCSDLDLSFIKVYFCLWSLLVFIKRGAYKFFEWCWKREKALCKKWYKKELV
jgi:hypothetical protein